jgi:glutathione S-transferase
MTITLCGFAVSNYYNKVKLALLEKGVDFQEELNWATKDEATLAASPLGKVPFVRTEHGPISESQVIMEYIEDRYPAHPLMPADPYQRAKVRELVQYLELHLELVARRLYPQAFFGGKVEPSRSLRHSRRSWRAMRSPWPTAQPLCRYP